MDAMVALLAVIFVVVPIVELFVIIQVGQAIGALNTIALLLVVGFVGAWLAKREGMAVWLRFRRQVEAGAVPGREIVDGVLILFAGALMLTPGFVTDILALLLLLPPVRAVVRATLLKRFVGRVIEVRGRPTLDADGWHANGWAAARLRAGGAPRRSCRDRGWANPTGSPATSWRPRRSTS